MKIFDKCTESFRSTSNRPAWGASWLVLLVLLCFGNFNMSMADPNSADNSTNIVLHRPYDYWPLPNYGLTKDPDDSIQLTDGETFYRDRTPLWRRKSTVGWALPLNDPAVIWFDLGATATLRELHVATTLGNSGSGVVDFGLRVFTSLDDKTYYLAGERPAPIPGSPAPITGGQSMDVPLNGCQARYVAVAAMAPAPFYFVFIDEIELMGGPAIAGQATAPVQESISASGAKSIQQALSGALRASQLMNDLLAPTAIQTNEWPPDLMAAQNQDILEFKRKSVKTPGDYELLRAQATERHRLLARQAYGADTLIWEVPPGSTFGPLTLPRHLKPARQAGIDTVGNALEATALGAANLGAQALPLKAIVTGGGAGAPALTVRMARFFATTNGHYVPDALLATDSPESIPSGESRLIWIEALSGQAQPGEYRYRVAVSLGDDTQMVPLTVRVHGVMLSNSTPLATQDWSYLNSVHDVAIYHELCDTMLEHRVTVSMNSMSALPLPAKDAMGNVLRPLRLDFSKMDETLELQRNFQQIGWFLPFSATEPKPAADWFGPAPWMSEEFRDIFSEWLNLCVAHMKTRGWGYDRFFFQNFDETLDPKVAEITRLTHRIDPQVRTMMTIPVASAASTQEFVDAGMNIFCYHAPRLNYDNAPDGFPLLSSDGRALWFYGAADSVFGDGKERDPLNFYRLMFWKAYRYGATGVGFWNMIVNNGHSPVWSDENTNQVYYPQVYLNAAGYPPPPADIKTAERVIPSRRWEYQRMGTEDYMLLCLTRDKIKGLGGAGSPYRTELDDIVRTVLTKSMNDESLFREQRLRLIELAERVVALKNP